ncbi:MAG: serine hydrolase [Fastidiosipilaceae bacterium]
MTTTTEVSTSDTSDPDQNTSLTERSLDEVLLSYCAEQGIEDSLSYVYKNLETGSVVSHRADVGYPAASTVKLAMALYCYDRATAGDLDLDQSLTYDETRDWEAGAGLLAGATDGDQFTISQLLSSAIIHSDNIATNMIFRYWRETGSSLSTRIDDAYGLDYSDGGILTAAQGIALLERAYRNPDDNPYYDRLLNDLLNSTWDDYTTHDLPVATANKYGSLRCCHHELSIVYADTPYLLSVYSASLERPQANLRRIGRLVYDWHQANN